jgi:penicillin amidase
MGAAGWWFVFRPLPNLDGVCQAKGLRASVLVSFDGRGVPYLKARTKPDLYLAQGYQTARDRLFQMDMLRRIASGQLSQVYGSGCLPVDKFVRTLGFRRQATAQLEHLSPDARAVLTAYALGVNNFIDENAGKLPVEFTLLGYQPEPWTEIDSLVILQHYAFSVDESWLLDDLRQRVLDKSGPQLAQALFMPAYEKRIAKAVPAGVKSELCIAQLNASQSVTLADAQIYKSLTDLSKIAAQARFLNGPAANIGSVAFALSPSLSQSGGALLGASKHYYLMCPDLWYLNYLSCDEQKLAGATIPGVPGIMSGRNSHVAWSSASLKADVQDLFLEAMDPQSTIKYRSGNGVVAAKEIIETIPVRFGKDVLHKVLVTRHGPILVNFKNSAISLAWTGDNGDKPNFESICALNNATNWQEFRLALSKHTAPVQAFVYVDDSGNIGYQAAGAVPLRAGSDGKSILGNCITRGWLGQGQWVSNIGFADMPSLFNPPSGMVIADNGRPQWLGARYSSYIGASIYPPYANQRLQSLLGKFKKNGARANTSDVNTILSDEQAALYGTVLSSVRQSLVSENIIDQKLLRAMQLFNNWDGQLKSNSSAAFIYESFVHHLAQRLLEPKLGTDLTREYMRSCPQWLVLVDAFLQDVGRPGVKVKQDINGWLPQDERTGNTFVAVALNEALNGSINTVGRQADLSWGALHKVGFPHIVTWGIPWLGEYLKLGEYKLGADDYCLNQIDCYSRTAKPGELNDLKLQSGPNLRFIADMSQGSKIYQSVCLGQSGQVFSAYFNDQLNNWLNDNPLPIGFSEKQINEQAKHNGIITGDIGGN